MKFVSCLGWVERGIPSAVPTKVKLDKEELHELLARSDGVTETTSESEFERAGAAPSTSRGLRGSNPQKKSEENSESENSEEKSEEKNSRKKEPNIDDIEAKYALDKYDLDPTVEPDLSGIATFAAETDDPYITQHDNEEEEDEDFVLKPTDNLLIAGCVMKDEFSLEVHVYNSEDDAFYVHHDYMLSDPPVCLEIIQYDPGSEEPGNLCAVGSMRPSIDIWDLNLVEALEPVVVLGKLKKSKKAKTGSADKSKLVHTDAVIDLAWNRNAEQVLASASADANIILWDLEKTKGNTMLQGHSDKPQTIKWHPLESSILLSGDCASVVKLWECRAGNAKLSWTLSGEIERVCWNHFNPFCCWASNDQGYVYYLDSRNSSSPLWSMQCHGEAVTGLVLSPKVQNCLLTASTEGTMKIWNLAKKGSDGQEMCCVGLKTLPKLGRAHASAFCPDNEWLVALAGDKVNDDGLDLIDVRNVGEVANEFSVPSIATTGSDKAEHASSVSNANEESPSDLATNNSKTKRKNRTNSLSSTTSRESSSKEDCSTASATFKEPNKKKRSSEVAKKNSGEIVTEKTLST